MIQGNITVENNLILKQPLKSYSGTVKYAKMDSSGNLLEDYPTNEDFTNFRVNNSWSAISAKDAGIDNTNNDININSMSYGNGVCIATCINSNYVFQSLDYGETWDAIDLGYTAARTTKFINDAHYVVDYKKIYILDSKDPKFVPNDNVYSTISGSTYSNNEYIVPNNDGTKFLIIPTDNISSNTLKFQYAISSSITNLNTTSYTTVDKTTLGFSTNNEIVIIRVTYDEKMGKYIILSLTDDNKLYATVITTSGTVSSSALVCSNAKSEYVDILNSGSKQVIGYNDAVYYTTDMKNFTKVDLSTLMDKYSLFTIDKMVYQNGMYFALFNSASYYVLKSADGINWSASSELPIEAIWADVIYVNSRYYFISYDCEIVSSTTTGGDGTELQFKFSTINMGNFQMSGSYRYGGCVKCGTKYIILASNESEIFVSYNNSLDKLNLITPDSTEDLRVSYEGGLTGVLKKGIYKRTNNGVEEAYILGNSSLYSVTLSGVRNYCISNGNSVLLGTQTHRYKISKLIYTDDSVSTVDVSILEKDTQNLYRIKKDNTITKYTVKTSDSTYPDPVDAFMFKGKNILLGGRAPLQEFEITSGTFKLKDILSSNKSNVISNGDIVNPCYAFGIDTLVVLSRGGIKNSVTLELSSSTCTLYKSNSVLAKDQSHDVTYACGMFLAIADNYVYYSKDGKSWNYKKLNELSIPSDSDACAAITYIPEKQRLLIVNTSFKGNSYIAMYDNYLGLVSDLDDHSYKIDDIYDHVRALSELYLADDE